MAEDVASLEPRPLWKRFAELARIPRPSGHEAAVAAWIRGIAADRGWEVRGDAAGNLVVAVPARPGRESAPVVVLQSHTDMVCEKNEEVTHDFMRDPIRARVDGEWVRATGTTLGADNGIGVAAALAAAESDGIDRGALELLFTVDEETGLTGAASLDGSLVRGRVMLNLDSEEDGTIFVGCAGGEDSIVRLPVTREAVGGDLFFQRVRVWGLRGGHSGMEIDRGRGNAIKLLARALDLALTRAPGLRLVGLAGGAMRNAIPREAAAVVAVGDAEQVALREAVERTAAEAAEELGSADDGVRITLEAAPADTAARGVVSRADRDRLLRLLLALPQGPLAMSRSIEGLVDTSVCLSVASDSGDAFELAVSGRSSHDGALHAITRRVAATAALAGAEHRARDGYPGWTPDLDSPALAVLRSACATVWDTPPEVTAVHAGLECGLIGRRIQGIDMVSFGPRIEGAHSPDERVHVASVARFWRALSAALRGFAAG